MQIATYLRPDERLENGKQHIKYVRIVDDEDWLKTNRYTLLQPIQNHRGEWRSKVNNLAET